MSQSRLLLHIDDRADDRVLFAQAFAKSGIAATLHSLVDAPEAMLYLQQIGPYRGAQRPKLIVLDLSMPRGDGLDFLAWIRSQARFKAIPIVILTSSENPADRQRCRELAVHGYMVKPRAHQDMVDLISSLEQVLVGSSPGSSTA